jgi:hypothetical protein
MKNMFKAYVEYLKDNPNGYWFKRKLYGWGWTPATWEGWAASALYVIAILFFASTIDVDSSKKEVMLMLVVPLLVLTAAFIRLCYKKGEKPRWQWGRESEE